ncbi:MAG TPA: outer membrane protein assembly factor BamE [Phenylobacterium sp.]|jgi:outer membrane protein assembly factor BamE (lipoprotein component of BamABCDE complex)|uniref:Outer membrane protein assembly factor BamE n=1 Tax=Phenylobacterium conjunctum TaxID=1298959 RepID=A0ABW3SWW4_9CAUL|nr:outer membrane protein assembly factor BamE [Phenylobacterium sp.]HQN51921.1 outer membrane protein assembly factor BamE [Phenylobacterium sp.]
MLRRAAFAALSVSLLATAACTPITTYSGFQAIEANPKDVKVGEDSKSSVRGRLGSPSATSTFDPNVWFYIDQVKETVAFRKPVTTRRDVTAIKFDKDSEQVVSVDQLSLKDGKVIAFNGRETPTRGRELTIIEQLIGSVGRGGMLPNSDEGVPGSRPGDRR